MKTITVFTPTYNRAYILPQLYESLKRQTSQDFCWLIVDDGSTDNTKEIVDGWIREAIVDIRYYYQENGGKMRAHNYGVSLCDTELFLCCDSDDYLTDDAVGLINSLWLGAESKESLSGVIGPKCVYFHNKKLDSIIPKNAIVMTYNEFSNVYGKVKETFLAYRTDIIRQFPFPVQEGEKFIPEGFIYSQIDRSYKMIVLSKEIMICEYLADGYTNNGVITFVQNPKGMRLVKNAYIRQLRFDKQYLINGIDYVAASLFEGRTAVNIISESNKKLVTIMVLPFGYMRFYLLKRRYTKLLGSI